jgi:hypothetical protein
VASTASEESNLGRGARLALALAVVIAIEGLLQIAACSSERVTILLSSGVSRTIPDARLGTRPNPALLEHDAHGWRNAEHPARADVVVIGDSQTYGSEVTREQAWPQRLAAQLGRSTYNLALGGYGPVQYLRLMDDALALEPRLVLIGLYAGNDLADAYNAVHLRGLGDELLPDPSARQALETVAAERGDLADAWLATGRARRGPVRAALRRTLTDPIEQHSRLFGLWRALVRALSPPGPTPASAGANARPWTYYAQKVAHVEPELLLPVHDDRAGTILTPAARAAVLDARDPRIQEGLRISLAALDLAAHRCAARCQVVVVGIPTKELVFADLATTNAVELPGALTQLLADERGFWSDVQIFLGERRIGFIDTLPALRASLARGENPYAPDWNGHPNPIGNDVIARVVSRSPRVEPAASAAGR